MAEHEPSIGLSSDWFTRKPIFEALRLVFDLDPAHPGRDNPHCVVPARKIFTKADDGLRQPWPPGDLVFMNPPFGGRRGQVPWLRKFFQHGSGIAVVAARTSADWFHEVVVPNAELLLFPNGKTKFIRPSGSIGKEPGSGVALIAVGSIACAALRSGLGACYAPVPSLAPMTNNEKATRQADADERTLPPTTIPATVRSSRRADAQPVDPAPVTAHNAPFPVIQTAASGLSAAASCASASRASAREPQCRRFSDSRNRDECGW